MKTTHKFLPCCGLALALSSLAANAAMMFTFQRVSDTEATLTATGLVGLGFPTGENIGVWEKLELSGVMTSRDFGPAVGSVAQTPGIELAGSQLQGWTVLEGDMLPTPNFFFGDLDSATGSSIGTASGNVEWLPVGSTGPIFATYFGENSATNGLNGVYDVGTWEIVAPVPDSGSTIALMGSSLGFVLAAGAWPSIRRRRQAGSCRR